MAKRKVFSALEEKMLISYHRDGLLDLVVGTIILIFAFVAYFDEGVFISFMAIPGSLYVPLKQKITFPRSGMVRFSPASEQKRNLNLLLLVGILSFLGLIIFYLKSGSLSFNAVTFFMDNIVYLFGAVLGIGLFALGYFLKAQRFYYYALMAAPLIWGLGYLSYDIGISVALIGSAMILVGISLLSKFLKENKVLGVD